MHRLIISVFIVLAIIVIFYLIYQQKEIQTHRSGNTPGGGQPGTGNNTACVPAASYSPHRAAAHTQQHSGTARVGSI